MRDAGSGWIRLHPGEFFLLWEAMDLGDTPAALDLPRIGRTASARAALAESASVALRERGLGTITDPDPGLAGLLHALSAGALRVDLRVDGDAEPFRAVGATGSRGGAAAGVAGEDLRIGPVRRATLVPTLFEAVRPLPAGRGGPANIRLTDYRSACTLGVRHGENGFTDALADAGLRSGEIATIVRAVTTRSGGGRFGGSVRDTAGRWLRGDGTVSWVDTEEGRYVLRARGDWLTVTPADQPRVRSMADELVTDLCRLAGR